VRSPLSFLFWGGRGRHALGRRRRRLWSGLACGWRFSGAGAAGVNHICIYILMWMGGMWIRCGCHRRWGVRSAWRVASASLRQRQRAVQQCGCGMGAVRGGVGLIYLHESTAHGFGSGAGPGHELLTTTSAPSQHSSKSESDWSVSVGGRCGWAPSRASCAGAVVLGAIFCPPPFSCRAVPPPSPCPLPRPRLVLAKSSPL
jgi:hypothetical protein